MVSDKQFLDLQAQVAALSNLLRQKVLGNDPSTNLGLSSQAINFGGPSQAGSLTLQLNGISTSINNSTDPDLGQTVSLESKDITTPNGDKSAIAPNGYFILTWNGATYQTIGFLVDDGSGAGSLGLSNAAGSGQIVLDASIPQVQVTDSVHTSALFPNGIIVDDGIGIDAGPVVLGAHTLTFKKGILTTLV